MAKKKVKEEVKEKTPEEKCQEKLASDMTNAVNIHKAAYYGMSKMMDQVLSQEKVDTGVKDNTSGSFPFILAAKNGHLKEMTSLNAKGVDVNAQGFAGISALHQAAAHEHIECVNYLLQECKATVELEDDAGNTALHSASRAGHLKVVDILAEAGGSLEHKNKAGLTPMLSATLNNRGAVLEVLFKRNCDVKATDSKGDTAVHIAASCGYEKLMRQLLVKMPETLTVKNKAGKVPAECTQEKVIKDLIKQFSN